MSQKKVDAYKAEKAKRKETVASNKKKQKIRSLSARIGGLVVAALIVVALVFTVINTVKANQAAKPTYDISSYNIADYAGLQHDHDHEDEAEDDHDHDHDHDEDESQEDTTGETEESTTAAP